MATDPSRLEPRSIAHISLPFDLATTTLNSSPPVQWTNLQLASGGWIPLQVDIQDWPGIDTPLNLVFRAQTDWAFPTDFTVDNIRLLTRCASIST